MLSHVHTGVDQPQVQTKLPRSCPRTATPQLCVCVYVNSRCDRIFFLPHTRLGARERGSDPRAECSSCMHAIALFAVVAQHEVEMHASASPGSTGRFGLLSLKRRMGNVGGSEERQHYHADGVEERSTSCSSRPSTPRKPTTGESMDDPVSNPCENHCAQTSDQPSAP